MPPKKKLSDLEILAIKSWIDGAPFGQTSPSQLSKTSRLILTFNSSNSLGLATDQPTGSSLEFEQDLGQE